jgi:hypothetical protein
MQSGEDGKPVDHSVMQEDEYVLSDEKSHALEWYCVD